MFHIPNCSRHNLLLLNFIRVLENTSVVNKDSITKAYAKDWTLKAKNQTFD